MSKFIKNHYEKLLVALGALFLVVTALIFLWSVSYLSGIFDNIFNPNNGNDQAIRFNIEGANRLNLGISD